MTDPTAPLSTPATFGRWLKMKRQERGLSQRALAALAGVSHASISHAETHRILPGFTVVTKLERVLGVIPPELLESLPVDVSRTPSRESKAVCSPSQSGSTSDPVELVNLAKFLIAMREEAGLTQRQFARRARVSQGALAAAETGRCIPGKKFFAKLEGIYGSKIPRNFAEPVHVPYSLRVSGKPTEPSIPIRVSGKTHTRLARIAELLGETSRADALESAIMFTLKVLERREDGYAGILRKEGEPEIQLSLVI